MTFLCLLFKGQGDAVHNLAMVGHCQHHKSVFPPQLWTCIQRRKTEEAAYLLLSFLRGFSSLFFFFFPELCLLWTPSEQLIFSLVTPRKYHYVEMQLRLMLQRENVFLSVHCCDVLCKQGLWGQYWDYFFKPLCRLGFSESHSQHYSSSGSYHPFRARCKLFISKGCHFVFSSHASDLPGSLILSPWFWAGVL